MNRFLFSLFVLSVWMAAPVAVYAQTSNETRAIIQRLNQLESQLQMQQSGNANTTIIGGTGAPTPLVPMDGAMSSSGGGLANLEIRLSAIEEQMRSMNGMMERQGFDINQIKSKTEKLQADMEMRIAALEQARAVPSPAAAPVAAPADGGAIIPPGGTIQSSPSPAAGKASSADEVYDAAYTRLQQSDFAGADDAFKAFLDKYPKHTLAPNAYYWLGESQYARGKFETATATFAEAYQKFPKSNKAPDTLLKLGMSLSQTKKTKEACTVYRQLAKEFPAASGSTAAKVEAEMKKLKCS